MGERQSERGKRDTRKICFLKRQKEESKLQFSRVRCREKQERGKEAVNLEFRVATWYKVSCKLGVSGRYLVLGGATRMDSNFATGMAALDPYARIYMSSNSVYRPGPWVHPRLYGGMLTCRPLGCVDRPL